jgi:hypothetical protein
LAGNVFVPPIFNVAPFETLKVPPTTEVPLFAVNEEQSSVPETTAIFPLATEPELSDGKFPARVFVLPPLIRNVPYVIELLTVWLIDDDAYSTTLVLLSVVGLIL